MIFILVWSMECRYWRAACFQTKMNAERWEKSEGRWLGTVPSTPPLSTSQLEGLHDVKQFVLSGQRQTLLFSHADNEREVWDHRMEQLPPLTLPYPTLHTHSQLIRRMMSSLMLPTSPWITIIFSFGVLQNYPWCSLHDIGSEAPLTRLQTVLPGDEQTHGPLTNTQSKRVPPTQDKESNTSRRWTQLSSSPIIRPSLFFGIQPGTPFLASKTKDGEMGPPG